jgi:hypothetical protein
LSEGIEAATAVDITLLNAWSFLLRDVWNDAPLPDSQGPLRVELSHARNRLLEITPR